jgi:hypothetical protein
MKHITSVFLVAALLTTLLWACQKERNTHPASSDIAARIAQSNEMGYRGDSTHFDCPEGCRVRISFAVQDSCLRDSSLVVCVLGQDSVVICKKIKSTEGNGKGLRLFDIYTCMQSEAEYRLRVQGIKPGCGIVEVCLTQVPSPHPIPLLDCYYHDFSHGDLPIRFRCE